MQFFAILKHWWIIYWSFLVTLILLILISPFQRFLNYIRFNTLSSEFSFLYFSQGFLSSFPIYQFLSFSLGFLCLFPCLLSPRSRWDYSHFLKLFSALLCIFHLSTFHPSPSVLLFCCSLVFHHRGISSSEFQNSPCSVYFPRAYF